MNIMVIGGGGREHALVQSISKSPLCKKIYCLPGNGGIAADAECIDISAMDFDGITKFAADAEIDFAVVAPDNPLVDGLVDLLEGVGIPCFGPSKKAAIIEGSKVFSKQLMKEYNIPTAGYIIFNNPESAVEFIKDNREYPIVIKADGLAFGKGVIIAQNESEAIFAIDSIMKDKKFGVSGDTIVIEEFLVGPEVTVLSFTDGDTLIPMVSSMDHKRIFDGDKGPNTGGMGVIAPNPYYTKEVEARCIKEIFLPTVKAMNEKNRPFKGCLYFGLILTDKGPKVIEYNCRFGDPETQAVLPLLNEDLLSIMIAVSEQRLGEAKVTFKDKAACCVVLASTGYPGYYETDKEITFTALNNVDDIFIYHSGTKKKNEGLVSSGGRVLGITAIGDNLQTAVDLSYEYAQNVLFEGKYYRKDIGLKALNIKTKNN